MRGGGGVCVALRCGTSGHSVRPVQLPGPVLECATAPHTSAPPLATRQPSRNGSAKLILPETEKGIGCQSSLPFPRAGVGA
jgi:hypothetical protein